MNYVFYDFETTGLDTKFSQPIQIAAIVVDENFVQIDDPVNVRCRLKDGVIPVSYTHLTLPTIYSV